MKTSPAVADGDCLALVRDLDFDRYLSLLFVPEPERSAVAAIYAFSCEIARTRELVSDPMPGEIRFQWWRDTLEAPEGGDADQHPVARELRQVIARYGLPLKPFLDLIEARTFDLYDDPMPSVGDLEGYAGETASALVQLSAIVLAGGRDPGTADAAGHAGVAYAITGLLRALPWHARRRQMYLPADILDRYGVEPESVFAGEETPALKAAIGELAARARAHLSETRARIGCVSRPVAPAFLPVCLVEPLLDRIEAPGYQPFVRPAQLSRLKRLWIYWRTARQASRKAPGA